MSTFMEKRRGALGVRLYGHAGAGGRRPLAAWLLSLGHAGGVRVVRGGNRSMRHEGKQRRGLALTNSRRKRPLVKRNEGEADNPGPEEEADLIRIAGANVTSLRRRWPIANSWPYHVLCVQETMLGEHAQKEMDSILAADGWYASWGQPQPLKQKVRAGNTDGQNVNDARHGGVAIICARELILEATQRDKDFDYLFDDGRLHHAFLPTGTGKTGVHLLSLYGYATASSPEERRRRNRELYNGVLDYASSFGRVPIFIFGDFNPNPAEDDLVEEAIAGTDWSDIHATWAEGPENAPNTYLADSRSH